MNGIEEKEISEGQVVVFHPQELHKIEPITNDPRILGIKYIRGSSNLIELLSADWEGA